MQDYRLQFIDEAEWLASADAEGWVHTQEGSTSLAADGIDFDVIGLLYQDQPDPDAPAVLLPGWHVNLRFREGNLPQDMRSNIVIPANPKRTFAGGWFQGTPQ